MDLPTLLLSENKNKALKPHFVMNSGVNFNLNKLGKIGFRVNNIAGLYIKLQHTTLCL